jgi:multiple sugar transport system substrate-binding protein
VTARGDRQGREVVKRKQPIGDHKVRGEFSRRLLMEKETRPKVSRREFLKTAGSGLASVGLASLVNIPADVGAAEVKPPAITPEKGVTLRVLRWSGFVKSDEEVWNANTKKWEELTGNKVLIEYLSWEDVRPKSAMAATVAAGPDFVLGWHDDPHLYPGKLIDVSDIAEYLGKKYGGWYDVSRVYGYSAPLRRWVGVPFGSPAGLNNWRVSWVREAGYEKPPEKLDEFLKLCKKLKANKHPAGFCFGRAVGDGNNTCYWLFFAFGGKTVEKDNKTIAINRKETWDALEFAREFYEAQTEGVIAWLDPHNNKAFLAGEISMTQNGISIYYAAKGKEEWKAIAEDMDHAQMPIGPVGRPGQTSLITQGFIFKHTRFPNAARHYLLYMMEREQYAPWIDAMRGYVTQSLKDYAKLEVWTRDPKHTPYRDVIARTIPHCYAGTPGPQAAAALAEYVVVDMFQEVVSGRKTPKEAARGAEERLARIYR